MGIPFSNRTLNVALGGETSELQAKELFATLKKSQVKKLINYYQLDFDLLGYDFQEYIDLALYPADPSDDRVVNE